MSVLNLNDARAPKPAKLREHLEDHFRELEKTETACADLERRISALRVIERRPQDLRMQRGRATDRAVADLRAWIDAGALGPEPVVSRNADTLDADIADAEAKASAVAGSLNELLRQRAILEHDRQAKARQLNDALARELRIEAEAIGRRYAAGFAILADACQDLIGIAGAVDRLSGKSQAIGPFADMDFLQVPTFRLGATPEGALLRWIDFSVRGEWVEKWLSKASSWAASHGGQK